MRRLWVHPAHTVELFVNIFVPYGSISIVWENATTCVCYFVCWQDYWKTVIAVVMKLAPLTSSWPHLRCDVGLEEGEYK